MFKVLLYGFTIILLLAVPRSPGIFFAGHPKAALLFWFFSDFRCDVSLFILVLYINIKIGKIDDKC